MFEAAGFRNAFAVRDLPAGADAMDARYNMLYWVHRNGPGPSVGPSFSDPRTGEIIRTVVRMDAWRSLIGYNIYAGLLPAAGPMDVRHSEAFAMARRRQHAAHEIGPRLLSDNTRVVAGTHAVMIIVPSCLHSRGEMTFQGDAPALVHGNADGSIRYRGSPMNRPKRPVGQDPRMTVEKRAFVALSLSCAEGSIPSDALGGRQLGMMRWSALPVAWCYRQVRQTRRKTGNDDLLKCGLRMCICTPLFAEGVVKYSGLTSRRDAWCRANATTISHRPRKQRPALALERGTRALAVPYLWRCIPPFRRWAAPFWAWLQARHGSDLASGASRPRVEAILIETGPSLVLSAAVTRLTHRLTSHPLSPRTHLGAQRRPSRATSLSPHGAALL